jgi:hypothetical protein
MPKSPQRISKLDKTCPVEFFGLFCIFWGETRGAIFDRFEWIFLE